MRKRQPGARRPIISALRGPLTAVGLLALSGCEQRQTPVEFGIENQILYKGNATEPESLDPHIVRGGTEWTIVGALFEGLVAPDTETLEPRPAAAERWEVSPDGGTYRFHLRPGLKWSNGDPLDARDFVFSAQRLLSPKLGSSHVDNTLVFVKNARAYQAGEVKDFAEVGFRALDERTLEVELAAPAPFFLSALYQFYPVHRATLEKFDAVDRRGTAWIRPGNLVGNGAFRLTQWVPNQVVVVERNPHYRNAAQVQLAAVHFLPVENPATEEAAFRGGQLHLTSSVPSHKIGLYEKRPESGLQKLDDRGVYFYTLNPSRPPLTDKRVRQALSLALDREALTGHLLRGGKKPATSFTPPTLAGYEPPALVRFDPERARALLAEAGFPGGKGFPPLEILTDARDNHRLIAEVVQDMWSRHLGIPVRILSQETRVLISSKNAMDFAVARGSWNATTYQDPVYFLGAWTTGHHYNEAEWSNAEFDAWIKKAAETGNSRLRAACFAEAERIFLEEMPAIPIYFSSQTILKHPAVAGWKGAPFNDRRLSELSLRADEAPATP